MTDWAQWCKAAELLVRADQVSVSLPDGRAHQVTVTSTTDGLRLMAKVATRGALEKLGAPDVFVWTRNRSLSIVGFRIDRYDALIGEVCVPSAGLTGEEFVFYVRTLAAECDRLEALLTGEDRE